VQRKVTGGPTADPAQDRSAPAAVGDTRPVAPAPPRPTERRPDAEPPAAGVGEPCSRRRGGPIAKSGDPPWPAPAEVSAPSRACERRGFAKTP